MSARKYPDPVDIRGLIDGLGERVPPIGPDDLTILGGHIDARDADVARLLACFEKTALRYALWQHTASIALAHFSAGDASPRGCGPLERGRLFGCDGQTGEQIPTRGGDLELRRDGAVLRWRFVGARATEIVETLAAAGIRPVDYWQEHPTARLSWWRRSLLLWGEPREPVPPSAEESESAEPSAEPNLGREGASVPWLDARVAAACLDYPVPADAKRAEISYLDFSEAGAPAFVWWLEVNRHER